MVRRLEHRDLGVVAVKSDGGVGPLAADGVPADQHEAEVGAEGDRFFEVANGDADVLESAGHGGMLRKRVGTIVPGSRLHPGSTVAARRARERPPWTRGTAMTTLMVLRARVDGDPEELRQRYTSDPD